MEIENAVILALNEPRNYSQLRREARSIRKQHGETLSNESFDRALKSLFSAKLVKRKKINGREIEYSLNHESSGLVRNIMNIIKIIDDQIDWLEGFTKFIERKANEIDDGRTQLRKMKLSKLIAKDRLHNFVVREYQIIAMDLIRETLSMQKATFFFTSRIWNIPFTKKEQMQHQKRYSDIIDRLVNVIKKLDKNSADTIHTIIRKELEEEMLSNSINMERVKKFVTKPKLFFSESLS